MGITAAVMNIEGVSAGPMNGDGSRKLLIHDTEGTSIAGAVAAYRDKKSWPTYTVDCRKRLIARHLPDTVAARSLRNDPGGADQTNKDGSIHIQIEVVGFANNRDGSMFGSRADAEWFGREVVGPLCRQHDIPIQCPLPWVRYPDSAGEGASQRLSSAAWDAYSGICGHQHAPDNDHGDPGGIGSWMVIVLTAARQGDDWMSALTDAEQHELLILLREISEEITADGPECRLWEVTVGMRQLLKRAAPGYFAVTATGSTTTFYVAADNQSKLAMVTGSQLHQWLIQLHGLQELNTQPVVLAAAVLSGIPDAQ